MNSLSIFKELLSKSFQNVINNFKIYIPSFLSFLILDFFGAIPWTAIGFENNSIEEISFTLVIGIINLIIYVNVVLIEKSLIQSKAKESLIYAAPTYLINTLYVSLIIIAGLFCFIVPGIVAAILLSMAPLASVLIDKSDVSFFKLSYKLAKADLVLIFCFGAISLFLELPNLGFDIISNWQIQVALKGIYSFINAFFMVIYSVISVHLFYHLKSLVDQSDINANN